MLQTANEHTVYLLGIKQSNLKSPKCGCCVHCPQHHLFHIRHTLSLRSSNGKQAMQVFFYTTGELICCLASLGTQEGPTEGGGFQSYSIYTTFLE